MIPPGARVWIAMGHTDMRKGMQGLALTAWKTRILAARYVRTAAGSASAFSAAWSWSGWGKCWRRNAPTGRARGPSQCHAEFESDGQFRGAACKIAEEARAKAFAVDERFSSFGAVADFVVSRASSDPERMGPSWWGYEAGIACGLLGRTEEASRFFLGLTDDRVIQRAAHMLPLIGEPVAFRSKVNDIVAQERARLKLTALDKPAF